MFISIIQFALCISYLLFTIIEIPYILTTILLELLIIEEFTYMTSCLSFILSSFTILFILNFTSVPPSSLGLGGCL